MKKSTKLGFEETSRKTRVKMHKSGKHWVRTIMSQIGLLRLLKGGSGSEQDIKIRSIDTVESTHSVSIGALKGIAAAGALMGGSVLFAENVKAEVVTTTTSASTVLANQDTVVLPSTDTSASALDSASVSASESTSTSTSISDSESISSSELVSASESISTSVLTSTSALASTSESVSASVASTSISSTSVAAASTSAADASTTTTTSTITGNSETVAPASPTSVASTTTAVSTSESASTSEAVLTAISDATSTVAMMGAVAPMFAMASPMVTATATATSLNVEQNPDSNRSNFDSTVTNNNTTPTSPTSVTVAVPDQVTNDAIYHQTAITNGTARDVSTYAQLQTAWADNTVTYINITSGFSAPTTGNLVNRANGASVIINGNNNTIDIRDQNFGYSSTTSPTNITISNVTIKQGFFGNDGNSTALVYSPTVTSQLTANINNVTLTKSDVNGYNPIHVMYGIGSKVTFSGTNVFNISNEVTRSVGSINFANNASVTMNRTSNDINFSEFYFETIAPVGSVGYGNTLTMGDGSSNTAYTYNGISANFPAVYNDIYGITAGDNVTWTQSGFQYFLNGQQGATSSAQYTFGQNFTLNAPSTTQPGVIRLQGTQKAVFNAGTVFNVHQRATGGIFQVNSSGSSITFISPKSLYLDTENSTGAPTNTSNGIFTGTGTISMNNSSIRTWSNPNNSTTLPAGDQNAIFTKMVYANGVTTLTDMSGNTSTSPVIGTTTRELQTQAIPNGIINIQYVDAQGNSIGDPVPFDVSDQTQYNIGQTINLVTTQWATDNMPANYLWALADQVYSAALSDA